MVEAGEWEPDAENWVRWARTPGHDAYWYYCEGFFADFVPPPGKRTVEIGCGEGRVARDLAARGHRVAALDTSHTLVRMDAMQTTVGATRWRTAPHFPSVTVSSTSPSRTTPSRSCGTCPPPSSRLPGFSIAADACARASRTRLPTWAASTAPNRTTASCCAVATSSSHVSRRPCTATG